MANDEFPLLIDRRVGSIELSKYLKVPHEATTLEFGDVSFMGYAPDSQIWSIGIERKTIRDLAQSVISGRLSGHQLVGLLDFYNVVYILVEGIWRIKNGLIITPEAKSWRPVCGHGPKNRGFGYTEMANYLNSIQVQTGAHVWFTDSIQVTAEWIRHTYYWWQKPWDQHKSLNTFNYVAAKPPKARIIRPSLMHRMIKEIDGIGWEKGYELSRIFFTMEDLMNATAKDFIKVPGIGKTLAEKLYRDLHGRA